MEIQDTKNILVPYQEWDSRHQEHFGSSPTFLQLKFLSCFIWEENSELCFRFPLLAKSSDSLGKCQCDGIPKSVRLRPKVWIHITPSLQELLRDLTSGNIKMYYIRAKPCWGISPLLTCECPWNEKSEGKPSYFISGVISAATLLLPYEDPSKTLLHGTFPPSSKASVWGHWPKCMLKVCSPSNL